VKKKIFAGVFLVLLVVVAGGLTFLLSNLNSIVAGIIEKHGSEVTATSVAVSGVDISLRDGRASLSGLTIDSPDGFDARRAFSLGEIAVDIDLESLRGEPIVIREILVQAPVVQAEVREDGSSNLMALNRNVQAYAAGAAGGEGAGSGGGGEADQKRIRIDSFVFEQGRIEVDAAALGLEPRTVELPAIRLRDIGGAQGALPGEIGKAVLGALTRQAAEAVAKAGIEAKAKEALQDEAEEQGKKLLEKIGG
jgi:uncharacterized protein involved in outer membrane biogenesis